MGASGLHSGECAGNEAMINEGLRLSLSAPLPEKSIEILLEYLGQSLFCDRVYIFDTRFLLFKSETIKCPMI